MEFILLSSLEKVFSDEKPAAPALSGFSMLKNESSSFQAALYSDKDTTVNFEIGGDLAKCASAYLVKDVSVGSACLEDADDFYLRKTSGDYPDYLVPVSGEMKIDGGKWYSIWIEIKPEGDCIGKNTVTVKLNEKGECAGSGEVEVEVIDAVLPKQELIYTNWFHSDCLCNYYNVEPFSEEFWRICRNYVKTAVEHGMNCILTPVFTPPLDTRVGGERRTVQLVKVRCSGGKYFFDFSNFKKWVALCKECGIEYFEISHFFTQWGAKHAPKIVALDRKGREKKIFGWFTRTSSKAYDDFLTQFAAAFIKVVENEGIKDKCMLHVSDEPNEKQLKTYMKRSQFIAKIFPGFKVIDALSDFEFYEKGAVKNPVPCEDNINDFVGKVPELWAYYCCGQGNSYLPNRFIAMPSLRNRVLGMLLYKYDVKGFLQWGYNFYNNQYSIKAIDPYKVTDAGGSFPSGDSFMVYPAPNGETYASLRLKVFYDGFEDMLALKLLESKIGRDKVLELIDKDLFKPLTFMEYPHENDWLLEFREKINQMIKEK